MKKQNSSSPLQHEFVVWPVGQTRSFGQHASPVQVSPFSQQSVPHFVPSPFLQPHVAFPFCSPHFCFGPQQAVVVLLKQQLVPFAQQIVVPPGLAGWQLSPPSDWHDRHLPSTQISNEWQHVSPQRWPFPPHWFKFQLQFGRHLPSPSETQLGSWQQSYRLGVPSGFFSVEQVAFAPAMPGWATHTFVHVQPSLPHLH